MELNKLATTMAMATDSRAETWTTWSNYFSLMNDKEKASAFLLRASMKKKKKYKIEPFDLVFHFCFFLFS